MLILSLISLALNHSALCLHAVSRLHQTQLQGMQVVLPEAELMLCAGSILAQHHANACYKAAVLTKPVVLWT
jgi:hypothetical protein